MLVTKAKHDRLMGGWARAYSELVDKYSALVDKWNAVITKVNDGRLVPPQKATFTADEIDTLIRLCHPDRHNGSRAANDMTAKLMSLRK